MKTLINLIIKSCFLMLCITINAQRYPVQVTQTIIPPYSSRLSDYTTATNVKLRLDLLLTDVVLNNRQVRLRLRIKGNGFDIRSREVVSGGPQIFLNGGVLQQFTNLDLSAYFQLNNLVGISPQDYNKPLPEGVYSICWEVYDVITNQQINNPATGCSDVFIILNDPPFLNLPFRGDQLVAKDPMNIIFQWTPRHVNATNVSYDFELREIWDRNVDPQAAFLASPNYYTETLRTTTLLYDISKPVLLPKKMYGWRVRAKSLTGISENSIFKNNGYSEIYYFTYTNKCDAPTFILSEALNSSGVKITWQGNFEHRKFHVQYKREDIPDAEWFDVYTYNNQAQISNLKEGKTYLFRVGGSCNELNDFQQVYSYSPISQFTMPRKEEVATYNCGIIPEIDIKNFEPLQNIGVNETFTAGDFPITIKQIQGGNGVFSGKGFIVVPYLADTKIAVTFSSIKINDNYQLVDGVIKTTYDPTWGGVSDVNDAFVGNDGTVQTNTVDFVIADVQVDPNGDVIVIGINGEIVELPGGQDQVITDANGQTWTVDEEGNVTQTGEVAEGGATNSQNTNGVNNQGEAIAITAEGVVVTFENASDSIYGFDAYDKSDEATEGLYKKLNDNYYIPYKAVANGKTDRVIANLAITDAKVKPQDIIFKTKDGVAIKKVDSTSTSYTLELQGTFSDVSIETQALIKQKEKYEVAGAFIQYHAEIKEVAVTLVNTSNSSTRKIKESLQTIYEKALVKLDIKEINDFTNDLESIVSGNTITSGESGFLEKYTDQQKQINKALKDRKDFNQSAYYLILTDKKSSTSGEKGFMPLGKQFGYIYMGNGASEETVAHELGHGAFQLKHPFSPKSYGYDEATISWLLDYNGGDKIPYVHWKEIHNPKLRFGIFDKDEDAQSVTTTMPIELSINKKKYNGKYYYGYLTPSGERIILSQDYRPIFFHGIADDTYNNVVAGTLIGFKKKFKNIEGKVEEIKYRATIVNNEFLGYSDFKYENPDIKDDKHKSFVMGLPYGEPDVDNGHWKNYKFKGETIPEYKGQDKPILNIISDRFQNLGLFNTIELIKSIKYVNPTKVLGEGQIKITDREIKLLSGYYNSDEGQWFKDLLANAGRGSYTISHNERREVFLIIKIAEIYNRYPKIFREFTKFFNNWDLCSIKDVTFNYGKWDKENIPFGLHPSKKYTTWKKNLTLTESNDELYNFYQQFLIELFEFVQKEAKANVACLNQDFESKNKHELYECILRASEFELRDLPVQKQLIAIKKILSTSNSGGEISDEKEIQIARVFQAISKNKNSYTETLKYLENEKITYNWSIQTKNTQLPQEKTQPLWRALFENVEDEIFIVGEDNRQSIVRSIGQIFLGSKEYFVKQLQENINPELLTSMTFKDLKSLHDNFFTYENDYQNIFRRGWSDIEATAQGVGGITIYDEEDLYKSVDTKITDQDLINVRQKVKWGLFNSTTLKNEDLTPFQLVSFINISKNNLLKSFTAKDEQGNPQALFIPAFTLHYASETDRLTTKSDIIITTIDLLAFLPSGGVASLNTFGKFVYYADKVSSISSMAGTAFKETDPTLTEFSNHLSLVSGIASLGGLSKKMTRLSAQEKLVDVIKPDVVLRDVIHKDVLKSTNNQVENVNNFAERILKKEFDLSAITKEQIDVTKEILENEIKYLRDFPDFKATKVREAIAKVDQLGLEKLNITYKSVVDANLVSKEKIANALIELNKINNDGFIDIVIHGSKNKFVLDLPNGVNELEASNLVDYIKNEKAYENVKNFRLLTCANIDLAKDFARLLPEGYTVRAVDDIVRIHSDGGITTVSRDSNKSVGEWKDFTKQKDGTVKQKSAQSPKKPTTEHLTDFVQLGGNKAKYKNIRIVPEGKPYPEDFSDIEISELTPMHPAPRASQSDAVEKYIKKIKEDGFKVVNAEDGINPVRVVKLPDGTNIVMDGMHRVEAMRQLEENYIPVLFITYESLEDAVKKGMGIALLENVYQVLHIGKRTGYYKGTWMPEIPNMKKWKRNEILEEVNDFMSKEFPDLAGAEDKVFESLKNLIPKDKIQAFTKEFKGQKKKLLELAENPDIIDTWIAIEKLIENNTNSFPKNIVFTGSDRFKTGDDFTDIIIHFDDSGKFMMNVEGEEKVVSLYMLSKVINNISSSEKIRLLSCNNEKAVIELSKIIDKPIYASDGPVLLYPDGVVHHTEPFRKYHKGARSDLDEIPPSLERGKGTPFVLGKLEGDIDAFNKVFEQNSDNVKAKVKELGFDSETTNNFIENFSNLEKDLVEEIGNNTSLVASWKALYDINRSTPLEVISLEDLKDTDEVLASIGGYMKWKLTPEGKENRLWKQIEMRDGHFELFVLGGKKIDLADFTVSDIGELELDIALAPYLRKQGIASKVFEQLRKKYNPKEFIANWIDSDYYKEGRSTNLSQYLEYEHLGDKKAAFKTPSGKLAEKNGFTGEPIFILKKEDQIKVVFTKPENQIRSKFREMIVGVGDNIYHEVNLEKSIIKIESLKEDVAVSLINALKKAKSNVVRAFIEDLELWESWQILKNDANSLELDFLNLFTTKSVIYSYQKQIKSKIEKLKTLFPDSPQSELAVIFDYTKVAYVDLNQALRGKILMTDRIQGFANALEKSLKKFPKYSGNTYRGTSVLETRIAEYKNAFENKIPVLEKAYSSSSKKLEIANKHLLKRPKTGRKRILFTIKSKRGIDIEDVSAFGPTFREPSQTEAEVLHLANTKFLVTKYEEVTDKNGEDLILITFKDI
ncbi:ParB N-terminal domain-containing protein [Tenacibaculum agarivorans]|uniref:ParB N-terminal domain-containing protein n=1 Tax=Tenacibaculum agarivorans TaxID=1908389 RepID=UPI00117D7556|nr:ParB N-terminal domain-containing protein [Tenacibaculum agarivorans]